MSDEEQQSRRLAAIAGIGLLCAPAFLLPAGAVLIMSAATAAGVTNACENGFADGIAASGQWRPPFQQRYVRTSPYGMRFHPIKKVWKLHSGVDLVSQPGPGPVVAASAGTVQRASPYGGYGNAVIVRHAGGIETLYAHLNSIDSRIKPGVNVHMGQVLGVEGTTGSSTGNHLHFEVYRGGQPIDPVPFMQANKAPLTGQAVAPSAPSGTAPMDPAPADPVDLPDGEGGVGFELPPPGEPRKDSLHNKPLPIPPQIKAHYVKAANRYKIPWTLLAGIGMEETAHGKNKGTSYAGAEGLMQFMPATWVSMGVDGDGDGRADINNDADSAMSAANYLTKSGVTKGAAGVRKAIFAYNHADWYVNDVLFYAHHYGGGQVPGSQNACSSEPNPGGGDPNVPPIDDQRIRTVINWARTQVGDAYVMGANGPDSWDCSSYSQTAYSQIGVAMPRTAQSQRDWLARGNGYRVQPGQEKPGDLIFYDSYLGPNAIGHVAMVYDPASKKTIEAANSAVGVIYGSYAGYGQGKTIWEIWRVGDKKPAEV